ncbi:MAG: galactose-1-phosphate uridylyltransferase [Bryobacteraceae bacterium]
MPELRKDPVTGRWVIIATGRSKRPTDFSHEPVAPPRGGFCPFCPGNEAKTPQEVLAFRSNGHTNGPGWSLRVVPNKFPALEIEGDLNRQGDGIYDKMHGLGAHEVVIESPEHARTLATLSDAQVKDVLWAYRSRVLDLRQDKRLRYAVLFKNHGEAAGATLEHSHSQLIALPVVPQRVKQEIDGARAYFDFKERCIFCDIIRQETASNARVVFDTDRFVVLQPFAARFPFETWILPRAHESHFEEADPASLEPLAVVLRATLTRLDRVLEHAAYNFIIHTAPMQEPIAPHYHWHMEIMPKLTRVAGFEWATGIHINPTPPEESAKYLRE